jgi:hypothetical protein
VALAAFLLGLGKRGQFPDARQRQFGSGGPVQILNVLEQLAETEAGVTVNQ